MNSFKQIRTLRALGEFSLNSSRQIILTIAVFEQTTRRRRWRRLYLAQFQRRLNSTMHSPSTGGMTTLFGSILGHGPARLALNQSNINPYNQLVDSDIHFTVTRSLCVQRGQRHDRWSPENRRDKWPPKSGAQKLSSIGNFSDQRHLSAVDAVCLIAIAANTAVLVVDATTLICR